MTDKPQEDGKNPEIVKKELRFVHLRIHTDFSLDDGLQHVEDYCKYASLHKWPALSITDKMNVCGLVRLYEQASNGSKSFPGGVKPIAAVDINVHDESDPSCVTRLSLLAMNENGYHNICEIISRSYTRGYIRLPGVFCPAVELQWFTEKNSHNTSLLADDIIVLSGGREGALGRALLRRNQDEIDKLSKFYQQYFPDRFYLELIRTGRENEERCNALSISFAEQMDFPVVATNDVVFMNRDDFNYHEVRVSSQMKYTLSDPRRPKLYSPEQYLKTEEEMCELFKDIPEALENSVEIARRCNVYITLGKLRLPKFPVPADFNPDDKMKARVMKIWTDKDAKDAAKSGRPPKDFTNLSPRELEEQNEQLKLGCYLIWMAETGLEERLAFLFPDEKKRQEVRDEYDKRLTTELDVIIGMGFPGYFLIVMEFIQWSKKNGIPIGPGRGSGAGSLVAYSIKITDLNPLDFALLFERFLNPERVSMPDFDIDICMDRRGEVIQHVADLYGHDAVSQIITFGSMAAKAAIKDVTRVLNMSYTFGDVLAKMIPSAPGTKLRDAFDPEKNPDFAAKLQERYDNEPEVKEIIDISYRLEGVTKSTGKHAGGVVISPTTIVDYAPLLCEEDGSNPVTQYDKHDIENAGLVKFDFLGLKTLTIIQWALDMINQRKKKQGEEILDISRIPLDDPASYQTLLECETTGVFQLESTGMRNLIAKLKPDHFEDMIALVALFRPGPLDSGMVDNFVNRKHGREEVAYPMPEYQHECLKPILEPTYGVVVYQEQVMQLAQALSGYTLGGADLLRRAMGKKIAEEMVLHRKIFVDGAVKLGRDADIAGKIYDIVEKFAGYGFNKSHSAAYALLAYQTLWLKVHHPAEYLAAIMTGDKDNKDKIVSYVAELHRIGIRIEPPDVNTCQYNFTVNDEGSVVYGLCGVSGIGSLAVEEIVNKRSSGPYKDLFDFCCRVDISKFSRGLLETLIWVGAFDRLGTHRAALLDALPEAMKYASQKAAEQSAGQLSLFGNLMSEDPYRPKFREVPVFPDDVWLKEEKHYLGLYLTGHPINQYLEEIRHYAGVTLNKAVPNGYDNRKAISTIAGYALDASCFTTKKGTKMGTILLDDGTGRMEVLLFREVAEQYQHLLQPDQVLIVKGTLNEDRNDSSKINMIASEVQSVTQARVAFASCLLIKLHENQITETLCHKLLGILDRYRSKDLPVKICYYTPKSCVVMDVASEIGVAPCDELLTELRLLVGRDQVTVEFAD
ncbi:MAG: DNA polymerase III subunit alpha [Succinivibrionaceae bacterium]